jgi:CheY-like chemotaxis protein
MAQTPATFIGANGVKMKRLNRIKAFDADASPAAELAESRGRILRNDRSVTGMKTGSKLVLLVEDDPQVREFALLVLRGAGYEVVVAETAAQAQRQWDRHGGKCDLLLADMMIPNCSTGLELARRFRRDNAALPVIITSGFGPEIAGDQAGELKSLVFLRKPFKPDELLKAVSACWRVPVH